MSQKCSGDIEEVIHLPNDQDENQGPTEVKECIEPIRDGAPGARGAL